MIMAQPQNASAFEGQTATFSADATGVGPLAYQWRRNGTLIPGATSPSYTTPALTIAADNGTTYSVVVANGIGSATSTPATLTVAAAPPPPPAAPAGCTSTHRRWGGGGTLPLWQLLLLASLLLVSRVRIAQRGR